MDQRQDDQDAIALETLRGDQSHEHGIFEDQEGHHEHLHSHIGEDGMSYEHVHRHRHSMGELSHDHSHSLHPEEEDKKSGLQALTLKVKNWCKCNRTVRFVILRISLRIVVLAAIIIILWRLPISWQSILDWYLNGVKSAGLVGGPLVFWTGAVVFSAISPTGYLPTVLAGVTFGYFLGPFIAYTSVNAGAMVNMVWVRLLREYLLRMPRIGNWLNRQRVGRIPQLERLLKNRPVYTVVLVRLPYLGNGTINYVLSLSSIGWKHSAIGNAIGFMPGAILFSVLGNQVTSLREIISSGGSNKTGLAIFCSVVAISVICIVVLVIVARRLVKRDRESIGTDCEMADSMEAQDSVQDGDKIDESSVSLISKESVEGGSSRDN